MKYRERMLEGVSLVEPPIGTYEIRPLGLTPLRALLFLGFVATSVGILLSQRMYEWIPAFLAIEFPLFLFIAKGMYKGVPAVRRLQLLHDEVRVQFQEGSPAKSLRLADLASYGCFISGGYYGYGDRWPTKGFHLGLVLLSHYKRIKEWIEGSHPLKGEPSLPKI